MGRTLTLDGAPFTVVGVMPPGFAVPTNPAELWTPLVPGAIDGDRAGRYLRVLGRLAPGRSIAEARTELEALAGRLAAQEPATNGGWTVSLRPLFEVVVGEGQDKPQVRLNVAGSPEHFLLAKSPDEGGEAVFEALRTAVEGGEKALRVTGRLDGWSGRWPNFLQKLPPKPRRILVTSFEKASIEKASDDEPR